MDNFHPRPINIDKLPEKVQLKTKRNQQILDHVKRNRQETGTGGDGSSSPHRDSKYNYHVV